MSHEHEDRGIKASSEGNSARCTITCCRTTLRLPGKLRQGERNTGWQFRAWHGCSWRIIWFSWPLPRTKHKHGRATLPFLIPSPIRSALPPQRHAQRKPDKLLVPPVQHRMRSECQQHLCKQIPFRTSQNNPTHISQVWLLKIKPCHVRVLKAGLPQASPWVRGATGCSNPESFASFRFSLLSRLDLLF